LVGDLHHVFARGSARQPIFGDDLDRRRYLALLARSTRRVGWSCLSYCLMSNHLHLLIETPVPNLSRGMHLLHGGYAQAFNRRYRTSGHLFQGRFRAVPVTTDDQLLTVVQYIARNPQEAGLCTDPEDWPWSSHASILRGDSPVWLDVSRLFEYFAAYGGEPRERYAELLKGARPL